MYMKKNNSLLEIAVSYDSIFVVWNFNMYFFFDKKNLICIYSCLIGSQNRYYFFYIHDGEGSKIRYAYWPFRHSGDFRGHAYATFPF